MADDDTLHDWELLHDSDTDSITSEKKSGSSSVIDDGKIVSDHFSVNNPTDLSQFGAGESSRVDYGSEPPKEVLVDLGFDQLNVNQLSDASVGNELGIYDSNSGILGDDELRLSDSEAANVKDEAVTELTDASQCLPESDDLGVSDERQIESHSGVEDSSKSWSDSGGNELVSGDYGIVNDEEEIVSDNGVVSNEAVDSVEVMAANSGDVGKRRETVWWKMPFVLLKYCTYRIGPVWFVSMSAAVMGLVLLGRRLYNKKKKAQRFRLNVTIDDKNASRAMSQAARLNEVFTEVRRVLVIRHATPSPGAWPVLSLR